MGTKFSDVHLEAEQVTETHRTLENDHTVTEVELPGTVNLWLVVDGGRVLLDQFKAPVVLEAIERGKKAKKDYDAEQAQPQTPADSGPQSTTTQQADTGSQPQG